MMKTARYQQGMSVFGWLLTLLLASFAFTSGLTLFQVYMDAWTVDRSIQSAVESGGNERQVRERLAKLFRVNQINVIKIKDIEFSTMKGGMGRLDASYEKRVHLIHNIDAVVKFDNLIYEYSAKSSGEG